MEIKVPQLSLIILMGVSGAGKSTFAQKYFQSTEIISSDYCRGLVSNDENSQEATNDAFDVLNFIVGKRLKRGLLTVIDATNTQKNSRKKFIDLAKEYHCLPVIIVLDLPEEVCQKRNTNRIDRNFGHHVIRLQRKQLKESMKSLKLEGFKQVHILKSEEEVESLVVIQREKLYNDKKDEKSNLDIIGDIHGCFDELIELLNKLGYTIKNVTEDSKNFGFEVETPIDRKVVFLGDLTDRGQNSPAVLCLVMSMVNSEKAYCVAGNHDVKLYQYLDKRKTIIPKHGLEMTIQQLEKETDTFKKSVRDFLYGLISHYVFDDGKLVVAHAGLIESMQGRGSAAVRNFCMYGETTGEIDEFGLPVRYNWAKEYKGKAKVVYGHTPIPTPEWLNKTIDIDTGCVFGGKLTALRYPEEIIVAVDAKKVYYTPIRPLDYDQQNEKLTSQQIYDDVLNIEDVIGKRIIQTRLKHNITILEEHSISALEVMSRFAINPKWLIYLPPTMSPCKTSTIDKYLEYPTEALDYYKKNKIEKVICEEKHMGSRAIIVICKDEKTVKERFGIENEGIGVCYTRTGRNFFNDKNIEKEFLDRVNQCLTNSDFWNKFETNWVCLDCELMPWSAKAQSLIKEQYASVGTAASTSLSMVENVLQKTIARGIIDAEIYLEKYSNKKQKINQYIKAYQNYCWEVNTIDDYKIAPFHILATEGKVHIDKNHQWHLQNIAEICEGDKKLFLATPYKIVDFTDENSYQQALDWWVNLTQKGGEGMVVKPLEFIVFGKNGLLQPAVKCRGSEYLRIIYGAEYDNEENITRLKNRGLSRKQSLALREFALGIEALERFINKEPLRRIHESVFGVLALESEEIDPRL